VRMDGPGHPDSPSSWRSRCDLRRFVVPEYPYDGLDAAKEVAGAWPAEWWICRWERDGPATGRPRSSAGAGRGRARRHGRGTRLPASIGTIELRQAIHSGKKTPSICDVPLDARRSAWVPKSSCRRTTVVHLRNPQRDTVLYPAVSYPTYAMGAQLAGSGRAGPRRRGVATRPRPGGRRRRGPRLAPMGQHARQPGRRPGRPVRGGAVGREREILLFSDECYAEFTWKRAASDRACHGVGPDGLGGVVAVPRCRSDPTWPGCGSVGIAGDPEVVDYLRELRNTRRFMVPSPVQQAAAGSRDTSHVEAQRARYWERLLRAREILGAVGVECDLPGGGFYLWAAAPGGDGWAWTRWLAEHGACSYRPGPFTVEPEPPCPPGDGRFHGSVEPGGGAPGRVVVLGGLSEKHTRRFIRSQPLEGRSATPARASSTSPLLTRNRLRLPEDLDLMAVEVVATEGDEVLPVLELTRRGAALGHRLVQFPNRGGVVEVEAEVVAGWHYSRSLGGEQGEKEAVVIGRRRRPPRRNFSRNPNHCS